MAALGVWVDGSAGVDVWHGMTDLADGARGVAGDFEYGAFEPGADGFWMAAEAIGGDRPVDAGPVDVNGFDESAEENRAEPEGVGRVVAHVGVVVVLRIDIPVLGVQAGVGGADAEAPGADGAAHGGGVETIEAAARGIGVIAELRGDGVPGGDERGVDGVHGSPLSAARGAQRGCVMPVRAETSGREPEDSRGYVLGVAGA